jgi:F-type H+-transporting ATPase subunit b
MMKREKIIAVILTAAVVLMAGVAFASGGGEHGSKWGGFVFQVINFAVLVAILAFAAIKADLRGMIAGRSEGIRKSIEDARKAREAAEKALSEVEEKLKTKDREIAEMMQVSEQSGSKERDRLVAEGERLSKSLIEQARANIGLELRQAREALKKEAAELALELAEQKIGQKLTAEDQKALFDDALKRLEDKS